MKSSLPKEKLTYKEVLKKAQDSARIGDAMGMFQGLCSSIVFEGYLSFFSNKYPGVEKDDIYDIIGISNDELYARVNRGEKIFRIESYLWKIIDRKLSELAKNKILHTSNNVENIGANQVSVNAEKLKGDAEIKRKKLFDAVEGLIPKLQIGNVQDVIKYIFGAVRNGAEDIPSKEIADALGLSSSNVRQCRKRGFERLLQRAKEENLIDLSGDIVFIEEIEYYIDEHEDNHDEPEIIE